MSNKYWSRLTTSQRNKPFNPLIWPFLISTFTYGIGFAAFGWTDAVQASSLFMAMSAVLPAAPFIWGVVAILVIVLGVVFLLFDKPPIGKLSGLVGFMVWVLAAFCYLLTGGYLTLFSVAVPNMYFWFWQYLSLTAFRKEDADDKQTMRDYDAGGYDDELNPKDSKAARDNNRGRDRQTAGKYDSPDDGTDLSRPVDPQV